MIVISTTKRNEIPEENSIKTQNLRTMHEKTKEPECPSPPVSNDEYVERKKQN